ncbi:MAG: tryptophan 7-halogenase, partial [Sphingomonas sp.]|nr:tryptophan 7-halogenase [Sphingomonas sp.]
RFNPLLRSEYNRKVRFDYERIRDFIIFHYHANQRDDSPFWIRCREMEIPEALKAKIEIFRASGKIYRDQDELFVEIGWFQTMTGQNIVPDTYHSMADVISRDELGGFMANVETIIARAAASLPDHEEFIASRQPARSVV